MKATEDYRPIRLVAQYHTEQRRRYLSNTLSLSKAGGCVWCKQLCPHPSSADRRGSRSSFIRYVPSKDSRCLFARHKVLRDCTGAPAACSQEQSLSTRAWLTIVSSHDGASVRRTKRCPCSFEAVVKRAFQKPQRGSCRWHRTMGEHATGSPQVCVGIAYVGTGRSKSGL